MCFFVTQSTACLAALRILTAKLLVHFNWLALGFEVTKWTLRQEIKPSCCEIFLLLKMIQSLECLLIKYMLQLGAREGTPALRTCETDRATFRLSNFGLDVLFRAVRAEKVHVLATAADHTVKRVLREATLTLAHLVVSLCSLEIELLHSFHLFDLTSSNLGQYPNVWQRRK